MDYCDVKIDLEVYKMIEAGRLNFSESHNDILRRKYDLTKEKQSSAQESAANPPPRYTGKFAFAYKGNAYAEASLKSAYKRILLLISADTANFLQELSKVETPGRRIVSQDPKALYKTSPHLAEDFAEKLDELYWYDSNLSNQQAKSRLSTACKIAKIDLGSTLKLHF